MSTTLAAVTRDSHPAVPIYTTTRTSPAEVEADRLAGGGERGRPVDCAGGGAPLTPRTRQAVLDVVTEDRADRLPPGIRGAAEARMGADFSRVSVHSGPRAAAASHAVGARAFTFGDHIVFGPGRFAPSTPAGRRLLTHELAHVAQQSRTSAPVVARAPEDDPDAGLSLGALDSRLATLGGEAALGETGWAVTREFIRGLWGGIKSIGGNQWERLRQKFSDIGVSDIANYAGGYVVGILAGLWSGLVGLLEGLWTLVTLPYKVAGFVFFTLPGLAAKYAPRIQQLVASSDEIKAMVARLLDNPKETVDQLRGFVDQMKAMALAKVRGLGHSAARQAVAFVDEPWYQFGRDVGKVVGQILFEVILALATEAIGNAIKAAAEIAGRIAARVGNVVELVRGAGRLLGQALEWLQAVGRKVAGKAGEVFEAFKTLFGKLRALLAELLGESAIAETGAGGIRMPVPDTRVGTALESRGLPTRKSPATVPDLTPPKVHPSKAAPVEKAAEVEKSAEAAKQPTFQKLGRGPEPSGQITAQPKGQPELPEGTHKITDKPNVGRLASLSDAEVLAQNLTRELGHRPPGHAAHHIVPKGMRQAEEAREILERANIGINEGANGVWLAEDMMVVNRDGSLIHSRIHTDKYIRNITALLRDAEAQRGAAGVRAEIRAIRLKINNHEIPF